MTLETALPTAQEAPASADQITADTSADTSTETQAEEQAEGEQKPKVEKTEEQRRIDRLQRGIDRKTSQLARERAERAIEQQELSRLKNGSARGTNESQQDDEPLTLSRAELNQMVKSEAERLAPTLKQQQTEIEHRTKVIDGLAKDLGQDRFNDLAADLDEAMGGLQRNGRATPATEAIFAADDPKAVMQYLADEDNADEAAVIGPLDLLRAGRAIAKLEMRLEQSKAAAKPQRSKAPEPVEPARASGAASTEPDTSKWTDAQWFKRHQSERK